MTSLIKSQKGGMKLANDGYFYVKNSASGGKVYWACEKKRVPQYSCPGRAITSSINENIEVLKTSEHNYSPETLEIRAKVLCNKIKERSKISKDKPSIILQEIKAQASIHEIMKLPSTAALTRTIQRVRRCDHDVISEDQKMTLLMTLLIFAFRNK